jgi:hypothetical protein
MLMVTTTVRMLNGVHGNTSNAWPAVSLGSIFVFCATSLKERLVNTSTTSDETNHSTACGGHGLLGSRWKFETSLSGIGVVGDDCAVVTGATSNVTTASWLLLKVANVGTLGHLTNGKDVTNSQGGLLTAVDELTSVHTLAGNKGLLAKLVTVRVTEDYAGKWGTTSRIVDDLLDETTDEAVTLSIVD